MQKDTPGVNPFGYGVPVPPQYFAGRVEQRADLKARVGGISAQSVSVVGLHRSGKSSLLQYIAGRIHEFCLPEQNPLVITLDLQSKSLHTPEGIVEGLRRRIERQTGHTPWRTDQNSDGFAVDDGLEALRDSNVRLLVQLDEFERIAARLDLFQEWGEDFRAKASAGYFAMILSTRRPLAEIYDECGLTSPFGNIFSTITLGALKRTEWMDFVRNSFARTGMTVSDVDLALIEELSGGLPFYMQMAASLLWQHRDQDKTRQAFRVQSSERFRELWSALSPAERSALRRAIGSGGQPPLAPGVVDDLERHGLLRDGDVFSSAFASFVQEQR
ncbi:nSTAND1 domain-containing NTPase [Polyangium jinanense]|uniref:Novel STAND NTPase 1 domain-containing protein n=1 Tax=Polyangium jinanense TaxID=2829994 RepID=A0A9X3WZT1_9BACT|nr:hypothetical protein [Polyangium jinanense]MDC3953272.1 hypothetical protein [Polyangium jinanense]MDC3979608.1 hypothetical protein [Polyangium jinanense]